MAGRAYQVRRDRSRVDEGVGIEPTIARVKFWCIANYATPQLVGVAGFEPATSWSQARRSASLNYTPESGGVTQEFNPRAFNGPRACQCQRYNSPQA